MDPIQEVAESADEDPFPAPDPDSDGYYPSGDTAYEFRYPKPDGGFDGCQWYYSTPPEPGPGGLLQSCVRMGHKIVNPDGTSRMEWRAIPSHLSAPIPLSNEVRMEAIRALEAQAANRGTLPNAPRHPPGEGDSFLDSSQKT
jgi:hypothetical protein